MPTRRALIRSIPSSPHYGWLEFAPSARRGYACTATLAIDADEWGIELDMINPYRHFMAEFFEELARCSDGWSGTKSWHSEFQQMEVDAAYDGEVGVRFDVWMCWPPERVEERSGSVVVSADDLPRFARDVRAVLRLDRHR